MLSESVPDPLQFGSSMSEFQKKHEKYLLKQLMMSQDYSMQNDSLNVQNSTLELDDPDDEKYDDGNTMSIRELK